MKLLAVDPGTTESAFVILDTETRQILLYDKLNNVQLKHLIHNRDLDYDKLVIEMVNNQGHMVGNTTFITCVWIGRFMEVDLNGDDERYKADLITRNDVKKILTGRVVKIKDSTLRGRMIEIYGEPGTKKNPGKTYGITKDVWQALALAEAWVQSKNN